MPETQQTQVQSLSQEDPLEKETAAHSSTLAWEIPGTEGAGRATVPGVADSETDLRLNNEEQTPQGSLPGSLPGLREPAEPASRKGHTALSLPIYLRL